MDALSKLQPDPTRRTHAVTALANAAQRGSPVFPAAAGLHFTPVTTDGTVDEVFYKGAHSASKSGSEGSTEGGTPLADWLHDRKIAAVDVVGIATDHCVKATALDGIRAGFDVPLCR